MASIILALLQKEDNIDYTLYWSSNGLVLLYFIQASLKADDVHSVGFLLSQNLISYVEKLYGTICENFKTKLKSLLTMHIEAPPRSESFHEKYSP
nr:hypothetical protein [Tanacetum cinerariifolium]